MTVNEKEIIKKLRNKIKSGNLCEECKITAASIIHHKDGIKSNNAQENLQILCPSCHMKIHAKLSRENCERIDLRLYGEKKERFLEMFKLCRFRSKTKFIRHLMEEGMKSMIDEGGMKKFEFDQTYGWYITYTPPSELNYYQGEEGYFHVPLKLYEQINVVKDMIKIRDGNKCRKCGVNNYEEKLEIHHIDENRANNSLKNLITLCHKCHKEAHRFIPEEYLKKAFVIWFYLTYPAPPNEPNIQEVGILPEDLRKNTKK